jgi:CRISPR-associated protein Csm1
MTSRIDASSRVALAAMLHDLGKFAERARLECDRARLDTYKQLDCPHWDGRPSHIHAAYTSVGFAAIEACLPLRAQLMSEPFASADQPDADDSIINAAARHHKPDTFLQWIIATADRLASGFERAEFDAYNRADEGTSTGRNHYQARLLTLFESIRFEEDRRPASAEFCLPLKPLSVKALFPRRRSEIEPSDNARAQEEYADLWQAFADGLKTIPRSHRDNLPLWLDHFDSAWLSYTHAIPSATAGKTRPDVSLYDHSKAVAALAVALWRWHEAVNETGADAIAAMKERSDWGTEKFLLVQGDFSGIQDFIFAEGGQTQSQAARILRGRSFQVSLLTELAALKVLDTLGLPPTSQIVNAAGKFLIVAPNFPEVADALTGVRRELDDWCIEHCFGEISINIVSQPASCSDFIKGRFDGLMKRLFAALDDAKLSRFDLCGDSAPAAIRAVEFPEGACVYDGHRPAATRVDDKPASMLAADQIAIGKHLANPQLNRLLVVTDDADLRDSASVKPLHLAYFGYRVAFACDEDSAGRFGELAAKDQLRRCWDFTLPTGERDTPLFRGYARRDVNAYVPVDDLKPVDLNTLATCDAGSVNALAVLKGDVDHLGAIFQEGIKPATFARMAAISRQTNAFFAIYLPWLCQTHYRDTYTVFAGGDDFFLIGPWHSTQSLAREMRAKFADYVVNSKITFSAGISLAKPGHPIRTLAANAEEALAAAKEGGRNRITCHGQTVTWEQLDRLSEFERWLDQAKQAHQLGTGFIYRLLHLAEKANSSKPEDAIWQSWLAYRVRRFVVDRMRGVSEKTKRDVQAEIAGELRTVIARDKLAVSIAIANHLYRHRD